MTKANYIDWENLRKIPFWGITNILYKSNSKVIFSQKYT